MIVAPFVCLAAIMLPMNGGISGREMPLNHVREVASGSSGCILQVALDGHMVGFAREGIVMAGGDHAVRIGFVGANAVAPEGFPAGDFPERVVYRNLWDKVDLVYEKTKTGLMKSTYVVSAGGDPGAIQLRYNSEIEPGGDGGLLFNYKTGRLTESRPVAWQEVGSVKKPIAASFRKVSGKEVGFAVKGWDGRSTLVIDPVLEWNTFFGSSGGDRSDINSIKVDSSGNVFVSGMSNAAWGSPMRAFGADWDAFVAMFDGNGNILWNTFLGGSGFDRGYEIALDASGNVFVAGASNASWESPVRAFGGSSDAFVAKLDSSGNLLWHTFLGGVGYDEGRGIAVDASGSVFVTGWSYDWGSPVRAYSGSGDAFVAKLGSSGNLIWSTFLGGSGSDYGFGIAVDGTGTVMIAGHGSAAWGSPVQAYNGGSDAFAARLDGSGNLVWNTFLGGSEEDYSYGIAFDASGNEFISGYSTAGWGSPVRAYTSGDDAFVVKLDPSGNLVWNTFIGGYASDYDAGGIAVDSAGNVFIAGGSDDSWGTPVRAYAENLDAFAAKIGGNGDLLWNTFIGGSGGDMSYGLAIDASGNIYVSGYSSASWGSPVAAHAGGSDALAVKLRLPMISGNTGAG